MGTSKSISDSNKLHAMLPFSGLWEVLWEVALNDIIRVVKPKNALQLPIAAQKKHIGVSCIKGEMTHGSRIISPVIVMSKIFLESGQVFFIKPRYVTLTYILKQYLQGYHNDKLTSHSEPKLPTVSQAIDFKCGYFDFP